MSGMALELLASRCKSRGMVNMIATIFNLNQKNSKLYTAEIKNECRKTIRPQDTRFICFENPYVHSSSREEAFHL